ncbi:MAG: hypothetical protein ACHQU0_00825 [Candidatus Paceibacteria bacterium]
MSISNNSSLRIGGFQDVRVLLGTLESLGYRVTRIANEMMHAQPAPIFLKDKSINLSIASVESIGFPTGATKQEIRAKFSASKLYPCPWIVGPLYRILYSDQVLGDKLHTGMIGIRTSCSENKCIFTLTHDDRGLILDGEDSEPDDFYEPFSKFILMRGWE